MKIVQSFWTKPMLHADEGGGSQTLSGGWLDKKFHFMSWALSCLQFTQYYDEVELVTDSLGKYLLIDKLQLPYTNVVEVLDSINEYDSSLWAMGKLVAFQRQRTPFLHADSDVYIWKRFSKDLEEAPLVAQNLEKGFAFYAALLDKIEKHFPFVPECIQLNRLRKNSANAYNAGILGGTNLAFFTDYTRKAFQFIDRNLDALARIQPGNFNCIYEQHLFYCLAEEYDIDVHCYSRTIQEHCLNVEFKGMHNFMGAPETKKYIHLYGDIKRNPRVCDTLRDKLKQKYPQYLELVEEMMKEFDYLGMQQH